MPYKDKEKARENSRKNYNLNREKKIEYQREWYKKNKDKTFNSMKKNYPKNREKHLIRLKSAYLTPINKSCDICHSKENLERHHWRYDKPLLVNTFCKTCHDIQHVKHFEKSCFGGN